MFRTFVRGVLKIALVISLYFLIRDYFSTWVVVLIASLACLALLKKQKTPKDRFDTDPVQPIAGEKNVLYPLKLNEISDKDRTQIAITIVSSFLLENVYMVDNEIELRLKTHEDGVYAKKQFHCGRIAKVSQDEVTHLEPYEVFRRLCANFSKDVDPKFLELMISFGWIGYEMGNRWPVSLRQIGEVAANAEDRLSLSNLISSYRVSGSSDSEFERVWNDACETLSSFVRSNSGMDAINRGELYWLPFFSDRS
jgi:hypothetical protein